MNMSRTNWLSIRCFISSLFVEIGNEIKDGQNYQNKANIQHQNYQLQSPLKLCYFALRQHLGSQEQLLNLATKMLGIVCNFSWLKLWLIAGNVLVMIVGLALATSSIGLQNALVESAFMLVKPFKHIVDTLAIAGCVFSISAVFGCGGALYEVSWMLLTNMVGLGIILLIELSVFIATFVIRAKIKNALNELDCEFCTVTMMAMIDNVLKSLVFVIITAFIVNSLLFYAAFKLVGCLKEKAKFDAIRDHLLTCSQEKTPIIPVTPKLPDSSANGIIPLYMEFCNAVKLANLSNRDILALDLSEDSVYHSRNLDGLTPDIRRRYVSPYVIRAKNRTRTQSSPPVLAVPRGSFTQSRNRLFATSHDLRLDSPMSSSTSPNNERYSTPRMTFTPQLHSSPIQRLSPYDVNDNLNSSMDSYKTPPSLSPVSYVHDGSSRYLQHLSPISGFYCSNSGKRIQSTQSLPNTGTVDRSKTCRKSLSSFLEPQSSLSDRTSSLSYHSPMHDARISPNLPIIQIFPAPTTPSDQTASSK